MTLEAIEKTTLADHLQLIDESGEVSERAVANLLRAPLVRWGLSPRRLILKYARDQLIAAGLDGMPRVLDRMIALGECGETHIEHERYIAPAEARWISAGAGVGVYLSVYPLPTGINREGRASHKDIVQRIRVESEDDAALLQLAGIREISLDEWLLPLGYLRHATRRLGKPARSDKMSLAAFWDLLADTFAREGLPLSTDADIRAVVGEPGNFFGRHDAKDPEGRWTAVPPNGVWCAYRRGYGDNHWHPAIIGVHDEQRRVLDLHNVDEWRWALLARGRRLGSNEVVINSDRRVKLTFPPPAQLDAAMDIMGIWNSPWTWDLQPGAPDIWALLP